MAVGMDATQLAIVIVVALANLAIAAAVYLRNKRSASNRAFAALVLAMVMWLAAAYLSDQPPLAEHAVLLNRLTLVCAIWMGSFIIRFSIIFPSHEARLPMHWRAFMWSAAGLGTITLTTSLVVADVRFRPGGTDIIGGPAMPVLVAWTCLGTVLGLIPLVRKYRSADGRQRTQLKFMLFAFAAFVFTSLLLGMVLPVVTGSYELAKLNNL